MDWWKTNWKRANECESTGQSEYPRATGDIAVLTGGIAGAAHAGTGNGVADGAAIVVAAAGVMRAHWASIPVAMNSFRSWLTWTSKHQSCSLGLPRSDFAGSVCSLCPSAFACAWTGTFPGNMTCHRIGKCESSNVSNPCAWECVPADWSRR